MTITRANLEFAIVADLGAWMAQAGLAVTVAGTNASLNGPIGWAIRTSGGTTGAPSLITDADILTVPATVSYDQLVDLSELRTLEAIYQSYTKVDVKDLTSEKKSDQFAARVWKAIQTKRELIADTYGIGGYTAFSITLTRTDGYSELAANDP